MPILNRVKAPMGRPDGRGGRVRLRSLRLQALAGDRLHMLELAVIVFLWQAAVGVYFLSLVQQYLPEQLDAGAAFPGFAMAAYGVAKFAWQPAAGWIADRAGRRRTMVLGVAFSVPVLSLMMSLPNELVFLGLSAVLGVCAATMWPAFMAHVGDSTPHHRRARTMSLINLAQMAGIGVGTLAGVLMVDFVTYGAAFWACIGFNVLALFFALRRGEAPRSDAAPFPALSHAGAKPRPAGWAPGMTTLATVVLFMTIGTSLHTPMVGAYTRDVLQVKMSYLALFFPVPAAIAGFVLWKFGHLADHFERHVPMVAGLVVAAACLFALTLTRSPMIAVSLVVLAGLAYAVCVPAWGAAALDATDAGARGLWLGSLGAVQGLGVAGGQALGGVIGGVWGPLAPFKFAALMLSIAIALIMVNQQRSRWRDRPAEPARA
jgi:MFS family permease